jgi:4-carboxymuconolactone decarboxylase
MGSHDEGMEMRRRVLGSDHVDRAIEDTTDLDRSFQDWITENVWGKVWTRPGLDLRTRSLLTIAVLGALNHQELELHLRASLNIGVSQEDVAEALLHVAVYAGVPAANRAFRMAKLVYEEAAL